MRLLLAMLLVAWATPLWAQKAVLAAVSHGNVTVFSTAGSEYETSQWAIHPKAARAFLWDRDYGGEQQAVCFYVGEYTVAFAAMTGGNLDLAIHHSGGSGPLPPPGPPPPGPKPPPTPPPQPGGDLTAWTTASVTRYVPAQYRVDAVNLAAALEGVNNRASSYNSPRLYREAVRQASHAALETDTASDAAWTKWSSEQLDPRLAKEVAAGRLTTIEQYVKVNAAVARGLRAVKVARIADRKPVVYVITRDPRPGVPICPACERLKREWLDWAMQQGRFGAELVQLDSYRDEAEVRRVAEVKMKMIKVPQIVIHRWIGGKGWVWKGGTMVGFTDRATTNRA